MGTFETSLRDVLASDAFADALALVLQEDAAPASPAGPFVWRATPLRDPASGLIVSIELRPVARAEIPE